MGAGGSVRLNALGAGPFTEEDVRRLAGEHFDQALFDTLKDAETLTITHAQLVPELMRVAKAAQGGPPATRQGLAAAEKAAEAVAPSTERGIFEAIDADDSGSITTIEACAFVGLMRMACASSEELAGLGAFQQALGAINLTGDAAVLTRAIWHENGLDELAGAEVDAFLDAVARMTADPASLAVVLQMMSQTLAIVQAHEWDVFKLTDVDSSGTVSGRELVGFIGILNDFTSTAEEKAGVAEYARYLASMLKHYGLTSKKLARGKVLTQTQFDGCGMEYEADSAAMAAFGAFMVGLCSEDRIGQLGYARANLKVMMMQEAAEVAATKIQSKQRGKLANARIANEAAAATRIQSVSRTKQASARVEALRAEEAA